MAELIAGSTAGGYELLHRGNINGLTLNNLTLTGTITIDSGAMLGVLSPTELGYLDGVTSSIQTQLNAKLPLAGGTITGNIVVGGTTRNISVIGTYDATKTQQIWAIGSGFLSSADGSNFGNLYGLAYKHTDNATGGTMAGGHQAVWCQGGSPTAAIGSGIWTNGNIYEGNTLLSSKYLGIAATAVSAGMVSVQNGSSDGNYFPIFVESSSSGNQVPRNNANLAFNPTTGNLTLGVQGSGVYFKDEASATSWHIHLHGDRIRSWNGTTELVYVTSGDNIASATTAGSCSGNAATATYAANSSKLYSTDSTYQYGAANPYYGYLTYNSSANRWTFKVSPATPADVEVAYATSAGSATTAATLATARTINGVSFNGSTNITVADSTKLPLAGGTITGNIVVGGTTRNLSVIGTYDSTKTQQIWAMGASYLSSADGSAFGSLYGLAYKHTNNTTGGTMASGHQVVWCQGGTGTAALGTNIWTSGAIIAASGSITGTMSAASFTGSLSGTATAAYYADLAECFVSEIPFKDCRGRILEIHHGKVRLALPASRQVVGVASDSWGFLLGGSVDEIKSGKKVPVGLSGTLWVDAADPVSDDHLGRFVISGVDGRAKVVGRRAALYYLGSIVGKIIEVDPAGNRLRILITLH